MNPSSDLALTLQGSPDTVYAGDTVTYTLTATNYGPSDASNVVVSDTLPANIESNVTATTSVSGVTPSIANGQVTADLGSMALGATATVTITVQPNAAGGPPDQRQRHHYQRHIRPQRGQQHATRGHDDRAARRRPAGGHHGQSHPGSGRPERAYTITATNNGLSGATGVVVTDTIPSGVTFVSATGGVTPDDTGNLTFSVGNLAANASTTFTVVVATSGTTPTPATDQATITGNQYDPNSSNNTATSSVPITPVTSLAITMSAAPDPVDVGSNLTYTIIATNSGPSTDPEATVIDTLPANVDFVSATGGATPSSGVLTLDLGSLAANALDHPHHRRDPQPRGGRDAHQ